jgi:hypothetical protein
LPASPLLHFFRAKASSYRTAPVIAATILCVSTLTRVTRASRSMTNFRAVLDEGGGNRILKNDVVARIALLEFLGDFRVEIVLFVLGLPIAERHTQGVEQRAID